MNQLTLPVKITDPARMPADELRKLGPAWEQGFKLLAEELSRRGAVDFTRLELPAGVDACRATRDGVPYRCIVQYCPIPLDGMPPGFRARIDVAWIGPGW